uniref:Uncharacterized protein n=1 Tax=Meloidogyne incognita TaxID=6306 RepID=A0A914KJB5_MELIC
MTFYSFGISAAFFGGGLAFLWLFWGVWHFFGSFGVGIGISAPSVIRHYDTAGILTQNP